MKDKNNKKLICPHCKKEIKGCTKTDGFFVICPHCGRRI